MAKLESLIVDMQLETADIRKGLDEMKGQLKDVASATDGLFNFTVLKDVGKIALEAGEKLAHFALEGAETADRMGKLAQAVGVPVEELTRLGYAASLSGLSTDELGQALGKLNIKISAAASGNKEASALFRALGVSVKDASGNVRSADVVMKDLAQKFSGLTDGASKGTLAVDLFGKSGKQLIPLLNEGAEGIKKLSDEADKYGVTISGKTVAAATEFNDNMERMKKAVEAVGVRVAAELGPAMVKLTEQFLNSKSGADALKDAVTVLTTVLKVMLTVAIGVAAAFEYVATALAGGVSSALAALSGDFEGANLIVKDMQKELADTVKNAGDRIKIVWDSNSKSFEETAKKHGESADKIVAAQKRIADSSKDMLDRFAEAKKLAEQLAAVRFGEIDTAHKSAGIDQAAAATGESYDNIGKDVREILRHSISGFEDFNAALETQTAAEKNILQAQLDMEEAKKQLDTEGYAQAVERLEHEQRVAVEAKRAVDAFKDIKADKIKLANAEFDHAIAGLGAMMSRFTSKLGDLGDVIQSGMQGFQQGGWWGAIAAILIELFSRFKGFADIVEKGNQQLQNVLGMLDGPFAGLAKGFMSFMDALDPLVQVITNLLSGPIRGLGDMLGHIASAIQPIFELIDAAFTPITQLTSFLFDLIDNFDPLSYVIKALGAVIKIVSLSILGVTLGIEKAIYWILEGIRQALVSLGLDDMAKGLSEIEIAVDKAANQTEGKINKIWKEIEHTFDEPEAKLEDGTAPVVVAVTDLGKASSGAAKAIDKLSGSLTNVPTGFRYDAAKFDSTTVNRRGGDLHVHFSGAVAMTMQQLAEQLQKVWKRDKFQRGGV